MSLPSSNLEHLRSPAMDEVCRLIQKEIQRSIGNLGQFLPCIVTKVEDSQFVWVRFNITTAATLPEVRLPVATTQYVRAPIQPGDMGITVAADCKIGSVTGTGSELPPRVVRMGNFSDLVFQPVANAKWRASENNNQVQINGPEGTRILQYDNEGNITTQILLTDGNIEGTVGDSRFNINGSEILAEATTIRLRGHVIIEGAVDQSGGNITSDSNVFANTNIGLATHKHTGVQTGGGTSGGPTP